MKRFLIPLFLFAFISSSFAGSTLFFRGTAGGSCMTVSFSHGGHDDLTSGLQEVFENADGDMLCTEFVTTSALTVCAVEVHAAKNGSPAMSTVFSIYTHDATYDEPETLVTNATTESKACSTAPATYDWWKFSFATSPSLAGSTTYWLCADSDTTNNVNNLFWNTGDQTTEHIVYDYEDDWSWEDMSSVKGFTFRLYE